MSKLSKVLLSVMLLGFAQELHAMAYVDPGSAGTLMRVLAPVFILVSVLGIQFKHRIGGLIRRAFHRTKPDDESQP